MVQQIIRCSDSGVVKGRSDSQVLNGVTREYLYDLTTPLVAPVFTEVVDDGCKFFVNSDRESTLRGLLNSWRIPLQKLAPELWDLEVSELKKAGPKSIVPGFKWWSTLSSYFDRSKLSPDVRCLRAAHDDVWASVGHLMDAAVFLPLDQVVTPMSTFSGAPYNTKTKESYEQILCDAREIINEIDVHGRFEYFYSLLGHRGQSKGLRKLPKQRVVWQYPKAPVVVGLSWLQSLIPQMRNHEAFVGWNHWSMIDSKMMTIMSDAVARKSTVISMDYSQFDATVSPALVEPLFDRCSLRSRLIPLLHEFFTSPIKTPDGIMTGRDHGVPSGHAWTNLVDSLANLTCIYYIGHRLGAHVLHASVMGDDSVVLYDKTLPLTECADVASELGLVLNADKSGQSDQQLHFLQKLYVAKPWCKGGIRSGMRTIQSMISLEKWSPEMSAAYNEARWWMQLDELRYHPLREEIVEWVMKADKYRLYSRKADLVRAAFEETSLAHENAWRMQQQFVPKAFWFSELITRR